MPDICNNHIHSPKHTQTQKVYFRIIVGPTKQQILKTDYLIFTPDITLHWFISIMTPTKTWGHILHELRIIFALLSIIEIECNYFILFN